MSVNIECLLMSTLKLLHEHLTRVCECESVCVYMCMCGRHPRHSLSISLSLCWWFRLHSGWFAISVDCKGSKAQLTNSQFSQLSDSGQEKIFTILVYAFKKLHTTTMDAHAHYTQLPVGHWCEKLQEVMWAVSWNLLRFGLPRVSVSTSTD